MNKRWVVYMVTCGDGTLYTGITVDLKRRVALHNAGKGAKYTRSRRPVEPAYVGEVLTRSDALKEENRIKSLTRVKKLMIIKENS
jgi:predicted GIY-YIG superfamily endonuclease